MQDTQIAIQKWKVWLLAIRPKTLTAALIPVAVGVALATTQCLEINWFLALLCLMCAFSIQIGSNLINDAIDFKKGADTETRIGPTRVTQSGLLKPKEVMIAGLGSLSLAILFGIPLVIAGGSAISFLLVISVCLAYLYTAGPFSLSYLGLGEIFVFLFFGLVATAGACYIQTHTVTLSSLVAGTQIGFLATLIIAINNLRDHQNDAKANKKTIVVRWGPTAGRLVITCCAFAPFFINVYWFFQGHLAAGLLPMVTLPVAMALVRSIWQVDPHPIYNRFFGFAALLHLLFGLMLSGGLLL